MVLPVDLLGLSNQRQRHFSVICQSVSSYESGRGGIGP